MRELESVGIRSKSLKSLIWIFIDKTSDQVTHYTNKKGEMVFRDKTTKIEVKSKTVYWIYIRISKNNLNPQYWRDKIIEWYAKVILETWWKGIFE